MKFLGLDITGRAWNVWRRDRDVFMKTYKTNFIPPFLEPVLYFLALGFGLGAFIEAIDGVSYARYIAPGLISISIMYSAFFECSYGSFVRMYYQKTFDAITATPLNIDETIAGEVMWGATKSMINGSIVTLIIVLFGFADLKFVLLMIPLAFFGGMMFASLAMLFTSLTPNIDSFNFPFFLLITPMFLFSGRPISSPYPRGHPRERDNLRRAHDHPSSQRGLHRYSLIDVLRGIRPVDETAPRQIAIPRKCQCTAQSDFD
jgi:lipooligosaccharide transport system permease protein